MYRSKPAVRLLTPIPVAVLLAPASCDTQQLDPAGIDAVSAAKPGQSGSHGGGNGSNPKADLSMTGANAAAASEQEVSQANSNLLVLTVNGFTVDHNFYHTWVNADGESDASDDAVGDANTCTFRHAGGLRPGRGRGGRGRTGGEARARRDHDQ